MKPFPFKRFLVNGLYVTLVNIACALVVTAVTGRADRFPIVLFFSICIGTTIFVGIEGVRLAFWGDGERINWAKFLPMLVIIVPAGQVIGSHLGAYLLGLDPVGNTPVLWSRRWLDDLLFTFTATGAAVALYVGRERLARARTEAANEKARAESIERQAVQAQLQVLQAQLEPHMLFNTLANVQGLIAIDPPRAQHMLDQLIQYLRATLGSSRSEQTTLAQEFALLDAYLGLMAVRMGSRLSYSLDLPPELRDTPLPPMLLQPLVENAIAHGLEPKIEGGRVTISAARRNQAIELTVTDNGRGPHAPPGKPGTSVGMSNTRNRLHAVYGAEASLSLLPAQPAGAIATILIPAHP
ncbi:MAG TPA: histidine kinase [Telluria sp.]|nr:histidine kinase [Telluria sp.]